MIKVEHQAHERLPRAGGASAKGSEPGTSREPGLRFDWKSAIANDDSRCKIGHQDTRMEVRADASPRRTAVKASEQSVPLRCSLNSANLIIVNRPRVHFALSTLCSLFDLSHFILCLSFYLLQSHAPDYKSSSHSPMFEINCSYLPLIALQHVPGFVGLWSFLSAVSVLPVWAWHRNSANNSAMRTLQHDYLSSTDLS